MVLTARTQELLEKVLAVLPTAEDEVITKGITSKRGRSDSGVEEIRPPLEGDLWQR